MHIIISPAKTLDFETTPVTDIFSQSEYLNKSSTLNAALKRHKAADISKLMGLSDNLAKLNVARYKAWKLPFTLGNAKQAVLAFKGDVYIGLNAESMSSDDFEFAQRHLRILSGLYGMLKPLDLIMPYRLEMGTRLVTQKGTNLYQYWGDGLTLALNKEAKDEAYAGEENILINLASNEYSKVIDRKKLKATLITPVFKDQKNGKYKVISFFAKKARGLMVRYIVDNRITEAEALKQFNVAGYYFDLEQSSATEFVFLRDEQA
ncbi:MAG: peroxide stress protein YaaA [Hyphomicrobiales bacterium]|nr:MAG: peroxide stress protein YaaA [Hyphomicrobiales bacterium]